GIDDAKLRELTAQLLAQPFDLAIGPMLRTHLVRVRDDAHLFVLSLHHIAGDGWSLDVLWRELGELYTALVEGRAPALAPLPIQYADYAAWQRTRLAGGELERQLRYWTETLRDAPTETALPFKGPRPSTPLSLDHRLTLRIDAELADGLRALARREGATMFMTLLAAFRALLARYTGQHDLVIGTPVANRNRPELDGLIGLFLNTLALRGEVRADDSFAALLAREKAIALGAYEHQETPIELIIDSLALERRPDLNPLFQVWFVHQNTPRHTPTLGGYAEVLGEDTFEGKSKFDISLYSIEDGRDIVIDLHYKPELLDRVTIERMIAHYRAVLAEVVADPGLRVDTLLADEASTPRYAPDRALIAAPGFRRLDASGELGVWHAFEAQAREHGDRHAIVDGDQRWTYRELEQRASALASQLLETSARRVALLFPHGADMVAAMLGALGAGALYVPLDSEHPVDRLRAIVTDCDAEVIVCAPSTRELAQSLGAPRVLVPSDAISPARLRRPRAAADDVAYILYTSGSTGLPKGVFQSQRNIAHHALTYANNVGIGPGDRVALLATYAFDAAVMDIYGALLTGATLYPWSVRTLGFEQLGGWIEREGITLLHGTPTVFREIVAEAARTSTAGQEFTTVRAVVLGGEAVGREDLELFRRHFPATSVLVNGLGPTESTLALQAFLTPTDGLGERNTVPVGSPVSPATEVILETPLGRQLAAYGVGELVIQSKHIALGYWKRPAETATAFGAGHQGIRRYHTGDLGRRLPDGRIEFVGRRDTQVKLRGVRIELGEIEAVLASCSGVASCAVVIRGPAADPMLVAFVAKPPEAAALTTSDLSAQLASRLPAYMVPQVIVFLAAMPLTTTGKVARKLLPEVDLSALDRGAFEAPRTPEEQGLAEIWREMLGVEHVGAHDNFFKLGGNSLMALRLVSRIRSKFAVSLPVRTVFTSPTLDAIAAMLKPDPAKETADTGIKFVPTSITEAAATTVQQYFYYLDRDDHDPISYYSPLVIQLDGPLDPGLLARTYDEMVRAHSVYRTAFREVGGQLRQFVLDAGEDRPPRLELDDRDEVPEEAWNAELSRAQTELAAKAYDLGEARGLIRARLLRLGANRYAIMVLRHHIAADGGAGQALTNHLYDNYLRLVDGKGSAPPPALQAIDFVDAHQKWARTPAGQAQEKLWKERLRNLVPVELEGDFPRAAIDARRDVVPLGITADQSYPPESIALPQEAYAAVVAAAAEAQTSAFVVFATALVWLLRERSHQDDISLQTTYSLREQDPKLADVHGALVSWSVIRVDLRGATTFKEAILRTKSFVDAMYDSGPPYDYYDVVPHGLRRVAFNYIPQGGGGGDDDSPPPVVTLSRRTWPFPPWKRPWDLHLTLIDSSTGARLVWTGFEKLFRRETIVAMLGRYIEILRGVGR
ncbi:MAG TPA: amino acid adenylation domain-containing protein, partial [Kofleriaceae bacterium]|nr:amino acid adenylation domain-containing protein [Kofleriaceae bacterium]